MDDTQNQPEAEPEQTEPFRGSVTLSEMLEAHQHNLDERAAGNCKGSEE